jgi:hypothetical protein
MPTETKRSEHVCSSGCACRSWECAECGTRDLVDRQTRWETGQGNDPLIFAVEMCAECGAPLCDGCVAADSHPLELKTPRGYVGVEHGDGIVHAIDLDDLHDDRPLWREAPVCGRATGVSSDEGGHAALHRRVLTCWECIAILA